jgi:hypothetical protein
VTLKEELDAVRGELVKADAKCATLMTAAGVGAAFLSRNTHGSTVYTVLLSAAAVGFVAVALMLLWAVLPRLGTTGFMRWSTMTPSKVEAEFTAGPRTDIGAEDLVVLSQILRRKYMRLRDAVYLTMGSLTILALAVLAGVVS